MIESGEPLWTPAASEVRRGRDDPASSEGRSRSPVVGLPHLAHLQPYDFAVRASPATVSRGCHDRVRANARRKRAIPESENTMRTAGAGEGMGTQVIVATFAGTDTA